MTISYVTGAQVTGVDAGNVTCQPGDLILVFAYRDGNNTAPGLASGFTAIANAGANTNSARIGYKIATGTTEATGSWSSATKVVAQVYRTSTYAAGGALGIGANAPGTASSTTVNYPALTLQDSSGSSWVAGFAGHRSVDTSVETAPSGMANRLATNNTTAEAAGHDTNGGVTSWSSTNVSVGGTSSGWRSYVVEIREVPPPPEGWTVLTQGGSTTNATSFNTASISPTAGALVLIAIDGMGLATTDRRVPASVGDFTLVDSSIIGDYSIGSVWQYKSDTPFSGAVAISFGSNTQDTISWIVLQREAADSVGTVAKDNATGTSPSPGTISFSGSDAETFVANFWSNSGSASVPAHTHDADFFEFAEQANVDSGWFTAVAVNVAADQQTTQTATLATSQTWASIGFEVTLAGGDPTPPTIDTDPVNQTAGVGSTATFDCVASSHGGTGLSYQWQVDDGNGWDDVGPDSFSYTTPTLTAGMDGYLYRVTVTDSAGSDTSATATLTVVDAPYIRSGFPVVADAAAAAEPYNVTSDEFSANAGDELVAFAIGGGLPMVASRNSADSAAGTLNWVRRLVTRVDYTNTSTNASGAQQVAVYSAVVPAGGITERARYTTAATANDNGDAVNPNLPARLIVVAVDNTNGIGAINWRGSVGGTGSEVTTGQAATQTIKPFGLNSLLLGAGWFINGTAPTAVSGSTEVVAPGTNRMPLYSRIGGAAGTAVALGSAATDGTLWALGLVEYLPTSMPKPPYKILAIGDSNVESTHAALSVVTHVQDALAPDFEVFQQGVWWAHVAQMRARWDAVSATLPAMDVALVNIGTNDVNETLEWSTTNQSDMASVFSDLETAGMHCAVFTGIGPLAGAGAPQAYYDARDWLTSNAPDDSHLWSIDPVADPAQNYLAVDADYLSADAKHINSAGDAILGTDLVTWIQGLTLGGGGTNLTVADAAHGHTADNVTLTTAALLAVADATHSHTAESQTLGTGLALTVAEAVHAHSAESPVLTTALSLAIAEAAHAHAADSPALSTALGLSVADALHAHTAESPTLATLWLLTVADALHGHAADNLTLSTADTTNLVVADAEHAHAAESPVLSTLWLLTVADALHAHAAEALTLGTTGATSLIVADAAHAHTADALALTSAVLLAIAEAVHAHAADNVAINTTGADSLNVADATHAQAADSLALSLALSLAIGDATHGHAAEQVELSLALLLDIADALHAHEAENLPLDGTSSVELAIAEALHGQSADVLTLALAGLLMIDPRFIVDRPARNRIVALAARLREVSRAARVRSLDSTEN